MTTHTATPTAPLPHPRPASDAPSPAGPASGVRARARVTAAPDGRGGTALPVLSGEAPLALRRTRAPGRGARLTLVGAMCAPLGGDRLALEARAEPGADLTLDGTAAMIALPGRTGEQAHYDVRLSVGEGARLAWLPEPLISAAGSDLRQTTRVDLAPGARLVLREEQILGRTGEGTGRLSTRLVVHRAGRPLLDQQLDYGPGVPGWDGPAVLGGNRAVGQILVVDPQFEEPGARPRETRLLGPGAAVTPLAGPAVLVTAVAPDGLQLRRALESAGRFTSW
ncbi:urease accessory protein UreD [Streptomyces sp. HNM0574]|uniref:urease accessory protein UreD n=1 Tax=Streptomyces sp. HNM0574 TaxID=2714954 RepID=UPI00146D05A8|nr:urease accessory protein UreD [Streptomyces sp. HNM0574]NLU69845.1 urease accessory protein UreD [Streptomyces sp. HNM0574]